MNRPIALIREAECIGCVKCIQACPVDAILGSAKNMHTVIAEECIGCKLCLPVCPVDCIDMMVSPQINLEMNSSESRRKKAAYIKKRFLARQKRLQCSEPIPLSQDEIKMDIQSTLARVRVQRKIYKGV